MAGPTASVLLKNAINDAIIQSVWDIVAPLTSSIAGCDFWIRDRPFVMQFGPEFPEELAEIAETGLPDVLRWAPADTIGMYAMCNRDEDHRLLGELCAAVADELDGVIDFGGRVGELPAQDGHSRAKPIRIDDPLPYTGTLYAVSYWVERNHYATCHYGDSRLVRSMLRAPVFRMVK